MNRAGRASTQWLLRIAGVLCIAAGTWAWGSVAWAALAEIDDLTPQSEAGGRMVGRAITGTVVMIAGMILLHFGQDAAERNQRDEPSSPGGRSR